MADSIRCLSSSNSLRYSTSLLTSLNNLHPIHLPLSNSCQRGFKFVDSSFVSLSYKPSKRISKVNAAVAEATDQPKWWEKNAGPNMIDIHSTEEFLSALKEAGDRLVVAEFFGTWCASCRALFPRLCRMAEEHPDILFLKVDFDANKQMCKSMNVKVLPFFHFYHGADGKVEEFSCSLAKFQRIRDAIEKHNSAPIMAKAGNDVAANSDDEPAKSSNT